MTRYGVRRYGNKKDTSDNYDRGLYYRDSSYNDSDGEDQVDNAQSKLLYHRGIERQSSCDIEDFDDSDDPYNQSSQSSKADGHNISEASSTYNYNKKGQYYLLWPVIIVVFGFIIYIYLANNKQNPNVYDERKFYNDIDGLGKKYKVNDNSILQIQTVISTTFQKQDTASFIFTYNSQNSQFNSESFNKFINDVAFTTARFLRNESDIKNHIIVESTELDMQYHSELIERYRNDVTKYGVMLVKDLDEVPSSLAMAFHYYCDEFNPLVKRSAIFFTLNMARCSDHKTTHASVEKCLAKKWTIIPKDNIVPLLTRIVNVVIDVTNIM